MIEMMKRTRNRRRSGDLLSGARKGSILLPILALMMALGLGACSSSHVDILEWASSEDIAVFTGNITAIYESAGCTVTDHVVTLSPTLQKMAKKKEGGNALEIKGVDLGNVLFTINKDNERALVFNITSQGDFEKYLRSIDQDLTLSEEDGYTIYTVDGVSVFTKDNVGCALVLPRREAHRVEVLESFKAKALAAPLKEWEIEALSQGNAIDMVGNVAKIYSSLGVGDDFLKSMSLSYDSTKVKDAYMTASLALPNLKMQLTSQLVDKEGKPLKSTIEYPSLDTSLLEYANATDLVVSMAAVPSNIDLSEYLDQTLQANPQYGQMMDNPSMREAMNTLRSFLGCIDGTVMMALGPKDIMGINNLKGWSGALAVQTKEGKMEELKAMVEQLCAQYGANIKADGKMTEISVPGIGSLYMESQGKTLIVALQPVSDKGGCTIAASDFKGMVGALIVRLPKDHVISRLVSLPFGVDLSMSSDGKEFSLVVEETDTDGVFLDNIIQFMAKMPGF